MKTVVSDPCVLLPAVFSPDGVRRKILVLFGLGALSHYLRFAYEEEREAWTTQLLRADATGSLSLDDVVREAERRRAVLKERLPVLAPEDLCLVTSRPILDEVARKAAAPHWADRLGSVVQDLPTFARFQLAAVTSIVAPDIDLSRVPRYTHDATDDYLVETAFAARADFIISDDKGVARDGDEPTVYVNEESGAIVQAYQPMAFVEAHVDTYHFSVHDVDPKLLAIAQRPAPPSTAGILGE